MTPIGDAPSRIEVPALPWKPCYCTTESIRMVLESKQVIDIHGR